MDYNKFEEKILSQIKKDKSKCIQTIENNEKLVKEYLTKTEKSNIIKEFVLKLNEIIAVNLKKFKLVEKVLKHSLFTDVLEEFRNSTALIRAIKRVNKDAIKWILTMNINLYVQDENGMTALMHAVRHVTLDSVVEDILNLDNDCIYITDNNNENVLFHSIGNKKVFEKILNSNADINNINKNGESILTYCCRNNTLPCFYDMIKKINVDPDLINHEGRTAVMYLVENGRNEELRQLFAITKCSVNFQNRMGENLPSILVNKFKELYANDTTSLIITYVNTLRHLVEIGCNLNVPIDEEGNTLIMYFMMIEEYFTVCYLLEKYENLDLSVKNKNGISASYLILFLDKLEELMIFRILNHKTFDYGAYDRYHNNLLIQYIVRNDSKGFFNVLKLINRDEKILNMVNDKKENALIIAVKLDYHEFLCATFLNENNIDQQDELGNTALFYAIQLKNKHSINILMNYKASLNIKNNQGISPLDLAKEINDENILEILNNPIPISEMESEFKEKKSWFKNEKTTDEKVDDYVKNYRIKNYQKDYNYIIEDTKKTYPTVRYGMIMEYQLLDAYEYLYSGDTPETMYEYKNRKRY